MTRQVLLVEDSRAMRDYMSSILESAGDYEVHEASNGFDALRTLPRVIFALIITDVNMPDVSGIELTKFVRQSARHADTPVIVISTDGSDLDRQRALEAGASAFMAKPFGSEEFLGAIADLISEAEPSE